MPEIANTLAVHTNIHFYSSILQKLTGLAYFHDPNWIPSKDGAEFSMDTLPFAFVHVIKDEIVQQSQISTKRIILYEEGLTAEEAKRKTRSGVLEAIVDNIVNEPVIHNLECLVPMSYVSKIFTGISGTLADVAASAFGMASTDLQAGSKELQDIQEQRNSVVSAFSATSTVIDYTSKIVNLMNKFVPSGSTMYNRNSLLFMQRNRSLLKFKTWEGMGKSVYGAIKNIKVWKEGTEDDYVHCTIEFQEMPVMTIVSKDGINKLKRDDGDNQFLPFIREGMNSVVKVLSDLLG